MAKILLIEDDEVMLSIIKGILLDAGHAVIEAIDAPSGFAAALAQSPDLILSDFIMPGVLDGPVENFFEQLCSHSKTKNIPIVIISGLPQVTIQSNVPKHLWPRILTKPLDYHRLVGVIQDALKQANSPPKTN